MGNKLNPISGWTRQETLKHFEEILSTLKTSQEKDNAIALWGEAKFNPKPKGLFAKYCPDCGSKLERENIRSAPMWDYVIYSCGHCKYKFVKRWYRDE